jgi:hypothetical protein
VVSCYLVATVDLMQAGSPPSIPGGATLVFDVELVSVQSASGGGVSSSGAAGQSNMIGFDDRSIIGGWLHPTPPENAVLPNLFQKKSQVGRQQPSGVVVVCPCVQRIEPESLIAAGISPLWCRATDDYNVHHFVQPKF